MAVPVRLLIQDTVCKKIFNCRKLPNS